MLIALTAVVVGIFLLTRSADWFVGGAARLSVALRISPVVIGAVVIGFGTSAPELVVSAVAAGQDKLDIAVGNVIGSNVANLTLVLGVAALLLPLGVEGSTLRREAPLSTASVLLLALLLQDGFHPREGAILAAVLVVALGLLLFGSRGGDEELVSEVDEYLGDDASMSKAREALRTVVGLAGVVAGAQLTVSGASGVADELGLGEGFVGFTLVAVGTSLPELVTAVAAARRDEAQLIVGNLLGSNLFNSLAVGASAGLFGDGAIDDPDLAGTATVLMVLVALGAFVFMFTGRRVGRAEAFVLLAAYAGTVPLLAS